ncbi:hypothetical protein J2X05_001688 [Cellvibrio fibrivorans]|uniref:Uncharacterized protein n=1 Tax=Cellvibrio fibrivorans TaxID=126350 RepID=A0ABU1UWV3_9GAMM|nr:hypothetical protein [Cellvibrio fibrivorans]
MSFNHGKKTDKFSANIVQATCFQASLSLPIPPDLYR